MNNIDHSIWRFLTGNGNSDDKEIEQINNWIERSDQNKKAFEIIKQNWRKRSNEPILINEDEAFDRIWARGTGQNRSFKKLPIHILKIAASILLIVTFSYFIFHYFDMSQQEVARVSAVAKELIVKENPAGQKSKLFLPDGTIIWLNAESSIQYTEDFSDSTRIVHLNGEAYFEVAKDSLRPFIVKTEKVCTQALGTIFNINSFAENEHININLISGKVKVNSVGSDQDIFLYPGEAVSYDRENQNVLKYHSDVSEVSSWKDGVLMFEDATFEQVVHQLKRWYGIEISVEGRPDKNWQFSGRFDNEYLINVLEVMKYNREFQYKLKNKDLKLIFY